MAVLNDQIIRDLTINASVPLVLRGFVKNWPICQWDIEKWCLVFKDKKLPFRCMKKDFMSDEPCWDRRCEVRNITFKAFVDTVPTNNNWMYFDYKHLQQWFLGDEELCKASNPY